MNRRELLAVAAASATGALLGDAAVGRPAPPPVVRARNVVLVHGLYADGSCWSDVIGRLQGAGLQVASVQNPLTSLDEAAASVRRVLARQDGPTVLVGHSFGGTVVSEVGDDRLVSALVFVAARAPDAGEDFGALAARFPKAPASAGILYDGDEGRLAEQAFLRDFAGDLPRERALILFAAQQPFRRGLVETRTSRAAWRIKPTYYAVSRRDRTIDPALQRFMAERMRARTVELDASHLSMISRPNEVAEVILRAARTR